MAEKGNGNGLEEQRPEDPATRRVVIETDGRNVKITTRQVSDLELIAICQKILRALGG